MELNFTQQRRGPQSKLQGFLYSCVAEKYRLLLTVDFVEAIQLSEVINAILKMPIVAFFEKKSPENRPTSLIVSDFDAEALTLLQKVTHVSLQFSASLPRQAPVQRWCSIPISRVPW